MHIPKYWAHGGDDLPATSGLPAVLRCWRWSDVSVDDARRLAAASRGAELAAMLQAGTPLDPYLYGDRPMREEIVRRRSIAAAGANVITRNLYGALVLNAERNPCSSTSIVSPPPGPAGRIKALKPTVQEITGRRSRVDGPGPDPDLGARQPNLGLRIYRTCAPACAAW